MTFWQLDSRCDAILRYLANSQDSLTVQEISRQFNISVRSVYYDLNKINDWLQMQQVSPILVERNRGIFVTKIQSEKIKQLLKGVEKTAYYVLSPQERQRILICTLLSSKSSIFVEQLSKICGISRNTTFNDLKIVREKISKYGLELSFEIQKGYTVLGSLIQQRAVFLYYFESLIPLLENNQLCPDQQLPFFDAEAVNHYMDLLHEIELQLETTYVEGMLMCLGTLISLIKKRDDTIELPEIDNEEILQSKEFKMVESRFGDFPFSEQLYIAIHLLGTRVQISSKSDANIKVSRLLPLSALLIQEFENLAALEFDDRDQLILQIAKHLDMSIYRYRYGIQIGNPLMADIISSYPDLFELTVKAVRVLRKALQMPIPDTEVAYLTMHLGGHLRRNIKANRSVDVLIVCPNGISTATILRGEVEGLHPNLNVMGIVGVEEIAPYLDKIDFIISTIDVNTTVPVIKVRPIITVDDRIRILSRAVKGHQAPRINRGVSVETVLSVIQNYVHGEDYRKVSRDLVNLFNPGSVDENLSAEPNIRLLDVINPRRIRFVETVESWEDALQLASGPLLEEGTIEPRYVEAMVNGIKRYGPYFVISPEVALAHALPKDGVNSLSVSLMLLKNPVMFLDRKVSILFVLAPIDKSSHLGIMKDLMSVLSNEDLLKGFQETDEHGILAKIKTVLSEKEELNYED